MAPSNRRGKDGSKPKGRNSAKSKNASGTTNKSDSVQRSGKNSSKGVEMMRRLSTSAGGNGKTLLEVKLLPIPLQQLLLNVFQSGLLSDRGFKPQPLSRPLSELVQILKTHLYRRDFLSAFADANEELLKAYALRWSAGRALGYAGIFASVFEMIIQHRTTATENETSGEHIVCIGGGAGAEIVGLAAAWRWLNDGNISNASAVVSSNSQGGIASINNNLKDLSLVNEIQTANNSHIDRSDDDRVRDTDTEPFVQHAFTDLSITAIDIADWSSLVNTLNKAISSEAIPSSKACPAPLMSFKSTETQVDRGFRVYFKKADVLNLTDQELRSLLIPSGNDMDGNVDIDSDHLAMKRNETMLVTLMFTLNELFSTSIPRTTALLLRLTDMFRPGTILLVVDSPGSYSTVALATSGGHSTQLPSTPSASISSKQDSVTRQDANDTLVKSDETKLQRNYPMRFLLDHALLSVADGKWERVVSDDSRWFRRDTSQLKYQVGDGIGLEDMRFQIHVYRRLKS
ncbi:hypothetical protein EMCG_02896 [[Emmonsia] crescens]|uniref:25S rRNA (Uridine(2843)-N(3))-methyltransferase n=1 Tax=[Emmonsia] crescens TaxID=73230 RepID=A0A0G2HYA2_9EURO|nr:hypothetical protein EMCG_02896 [Emmonsia crescens UAMH 3008]